MKIEKDNTLLISDVIEEIDPVRRAFKKFKNHPSTLLVKNYFQDSKAFSFKYFNVEDVKKDIDNIESKNGMPKSDIPAKIFMWSSDIIALTLTKCFCQNIKNSTFSDELKNRDIS